MSQLPDKECDYGYTRSQVRSIVGEWALPDFDRWMYGQTMALCEGKAYNHETKEYEESCNGVSHGPVVYGHDLKRFLLGLPVID